MRKTIAVGIFCSVLMAVPLAGAETCPAVPGGHATTAQLDASARLRFLEARLAKARRHAKIWNWSWSLGFLGVSGVYMAGSPLFDDPDDEQQVAFQKSLYVGAGKAFVAGVFGIIRQLRVIGVSAKDQSVCARLAAAERSLILTARLERRMKGWRMWVAGFALNMAGLGVLGYMGHWKEAALSVVTGVPTGQIKIWTQPTIADNTLRAYRLGRLPGTEANAAGVTVGPGPGVGLTLQLIR